MTHTHAQRTFTLSWRTIAGALPAVALIGSGVGLTLTGGNPATEIVVTIGACLEDVI